jgi:hypothetical protein
VSGYEQFLEIIADRDVPEHAEISYWCGGYFDPEWFDPLIADTDVRNPLRTNVKRRLYQSKLTRLKNRWQGRVASALNMG